MAATQPLNTQASGRQSAATNSNSTSATIPIFESTKGVIVADFTSRIILPNNDDGDLTYYKRRAKNEILPLIGGTGQITQAPARLCLE